MRNFPATQSEPENSWSENHYFEGMKMNQMQLIQRKEELIGKTNIDFLDQYSLNIAFENRFLSARQSSERADNSNLQRKSYV